MHNIILLGSGGHAKSVIDTIEKQKQYKIVGILDKKKEIEVIYRKYQRIGDDSELLNCYEKGIQYVFICVGFLGNSSIREQLYKKVKKIGFKIPTIIDSTAAIAEDVVLGKGSFIGKNAVVNSNSKIGKMCIINSGAIVEHDCIVGDFSHISVGSVMCGASKIGSSSFLGANSTVLQEKMIGSHVTIGAGSLILNHVEDDKILYGTI